MYDIHEIIAELKKYKRVKMVATFASPVCKKIVSITNIQPLVSFPDIIMVHPYFIPTFSFLCKSDEQILKEKPVLYIEHLIRIVERLMRTQVDFSLVTLLENRAKRHTSYLIIRIELEFAALAGAQADKLYHITPLCWTSYALLKGPLPPFSLEELEEISKDFVIPPIAHSAYESYAPSFNDKYGPEARKKYDRLHRRK